MAWRHPEQKPLASRSPDEIELSDAESKSSSSGSTTTSSRPDKRRRRCQVPEDEDDDGSPVLLSKNKRALARALVVFGLAASGVHLGLTVAYQIVEVATVRPGWGPADVGAPAFQLYKNSRFASCVGRAPPRVNCNLLGADLDRSWRPDLAWLGQPEEVRQRHRYFMSGARYSVVRKRSTTVATAAAAADDDDDDDDAQDAKPSWCDLVSCLAGWKVVPSTPRADAFGPTALTAWSSLLMTALGTFWLLRGLLAAPRPRRCARPGFLDAVLLAWEAGQLGFWWWTMTTSPGETTAAAAAAGAGAAGAAGLLALTGWVTTWTLAVKCTLHPWACRLAAPTRRGLAAALYAAAAVQWAATVYVLRRRDRHDHHHTTTVATPPNKYDCVAAGVAAAPGTSPCAADRLCAHPWLFRPPDFAGADEAAARAFYDVAVHLDLAAFALYLTARAAAAALARWGSRPLWARLRAARLSPVRSPDGRPECRRLLLGLFLARGYLHLLYALPFFVSAMDSLVDRDGGGFATVAYDFGCRAVHVGVSPKHFYLDINAFDRGLRIARQWFNA